MIEILNSWDISIFSFINSFHTPYIDNVMWLFSAKNTWYPIYLALIILLLIKDWKQAILIILLTALCIALADQMSSGLIKPLIERLRPSHNPALESSIHIIKDYRGGQYGFVSSHAANTTATVIFLSLIFKKWYFTLTSVCWAIIVSYSRIYLGVHYPGDIIGGLIIGIIAGTICYYLYDRINKRFILGGHYNDTNSIFIEGETYAIIINTILLIITAAFML